ncbi:MAG TPA: DUF3152 domain-containing protein [Marmoricola sp.]
MRQTVPGLRAALVKVSWVVVALTVALTLVEAAGAGRAGAAPLAAPGNTAAPAISGEARYGAAPLVASDGGWDAPDATFAYQWHRSGVPIPGATTATHAIVPDDIGRTLHVTVVATSGGESSAPAASAPTGPVQAGAFTNLTRPSISGVARWGRTLTGSRGSWTPGPSTVRYQWLRDGRAIRGATARTYELTVADFGSRISLRVVARRASYADRAAVSPATPRIGHRVKVRRTFSYTVRTRGRITTDVRQFARLAAATYADPRGWRSAGFRFTRVARGGQFTLVLANASQLPRFSSACSTRWSCRVGRYVVINQERWKHASAAWNDAGQPLRDYRHMVVNHETGHWLGHGHRGCPGAGRLAPVMMQQSKGLAGCRFNPFPLPSERWVRR